MLGHDNDAVGHFQRLVELGDEHQRRAVCRCLADLAANVAAGADVDALEGLVEQQQPTFLGQLARQHHLLLVAA